MLFRCVMLLALAVSGLALAACAEMGEAMAASAAEQAATIAATQAAIASTQAIDQLETASTQISNQVSTASTQPFFLPHLPPIGSGTVIADTPTALIVQVNGKRVIVLKSPPPTNDDADH
jgi:hypothetical protein